MLFIQRSKQNIITFSFKCLKNVFKKADLCVPQHKKIGKCYVLQNWLRRLSPFSCTNTLISPDLMSALQWFYKPGLKLDVSLHAWQLFNFKSAHIRLRKEKEFKWIFCFFTFCSWNIKYEEEEEEEGRHLKVCICRSRFVLLAPQHQNKVYLCILFCEAGSVGGFHLVCSRFSPRSFSASLKKSTAIRSVWVLSSQLNIPASGLVPKHV